MKPDGVYLIGDWRKSRRPAKLGPKIRGLLTLLLLVIAFDGQIKLLTSFITLSLNLPSIRQVEAYCDKTFTSTDEGSEGTEHSQAVRSFEAPNNTIKAKPYVIYKKKTGELMVSRNLSLAEEGAKTKSPSGSGRQAPVRSGKAFHCLYKFVAKEGERVAVSFFSFGLRGELPECNNEYVDIYLSLKSAEQSILSQLPDGRFCTTVVPRKLVSLHQVLVMSIYSDLEPPADGSPLFNGTYEFVKSKVNEQNIGPPEEGTLCQHTIRSSEKREGEFQSVTYPGIYLKGLDCSYKLIGEPGQRIRLEFLDLDLYSGGTHCPFDRIRIYDGLRETDPLIQTICGSHRSLIFFSTQNHLLVTFNTLQREVEIYDRGFSAYFEFSDKFHDTNFIQGPNARHIRGTECDQRIASTKGSSGVIVSPELKRDHPSAICRYFFEGLRSSHDYEKVLLKFTEFDLKTNRVTGDQAVGSAPIVTTTTTTTTAAPISPLLLLNQTLTLGNQNESSASSSGSTLASASSSPTSSGSAPGGASNGTEQCPDNYVRIFTSEQKPELKQDPNDYDYVFCGNEVPSTIESDTPSMLLEFNTGSLGGTFKAEYNFMVDYQIPGLQASTDCNYIYRSDLAHSGVFNSPHHPSWYINDVNCTYNFFTKADEALLLEFTTVKMAKSFGDALVGMNQNCTGEDSIEIDEVIFDTNDLSKVLDKYEIGTYCGNTRPGPILSFRPVQVHLRTNKEVAHYGFRAIYYFHPVSGLKTNEFVSNCGGQIQASHKQRTGQIASPPTYRSETNEKRNHICTWNITARPNHKIALDFDRFELEGLPASRGCATASVRIEFGRPKALPKELCGTMVFPAANGSYHQFVSDAEWLAITFISTKAASGSNGFTATWSEIKRKTY